MKKMETEDPRQNLFYTLRHLHDADQALSRARKKMPNHLQQRSKKANTDLNKVAANVREAIAEMDGAA